MAAVLSQRSAPKTLEKRTSSLKNYIIDKKISTGKYLIHKAWRKNSNEPVILKIFPTSPFENERFETEKRIFSSLNHPNIINLKALDSKVELKENQFYSYLALEFAAFGDFMQLILSHGEMSDKLARTFFHQLVEGLSHMHESGFAHLDLKLENLLLDEKFKLRITDFDFSQSLREEKLRFKGTPGSRAPEVKLGTATDFVAADVYSLAVVLFSMITANPAYSEVNKEGEMVYNAFYPLLRQNNEKFWEVHASIKKKENLFGKELISLLNWMWAEDASFRPTLKEIENHAWYKQEIFSDEDLVLEMKNYLKIKTF